jgi:EAL and modified HD-GYP domain-containing signal transduction protein
MPSAFAATLKQVWAQGFCIALDNYAFTADQRYLLDAASYVRIDVSRFNGLELAQYSATLLDESGVRLIAANVRSRDEFDACRKLPFDYHQGAFFTTPRIRPEARIDQPRAQVIEILNLVREKAELAAIERVLRRDPTLVYRLLRYINSPAVGLNREIRSISHALVMLGYQPLYRWLTLLLFASGPDAPRKRALLTHALVRGRLMELLGRASLPGTETDSLFVTGIFSVLDSLLDIPLPQALEGIRLPPPVTAALLENMGIYAPCLQLAIACEGTGQVRINELAAECGLAPAAVNAAHFEALLWAESLD